MEVYRNPEWKEDKELKADLKKYVLRNFKRREILDFMERDYPQYAWSLGTLSRRLKHFDTSYINYDLTVQEVEEVVREEQNGPGQLPPPPPSPRIDALHTPVYSICIL